MWMWMGMVWSWRCASVFDERHWSTPSGWTKQDMRLHTYGYEWADVQFFCSRPFLLLYNCQFCFSATLISAMVGLPPYVLLCLYTERIFPNQAHWGWLDVAFPAFIWRPFGPLHYIICHQCFTAGKVGMTFTFFIFGGYRSSPTDAVCALCHLLIPQLPVAAGVQHAGTEWINRHPVINAELHWWRVQLGNHVSAQKAHRRKKIRWNEQIK